MQQALYESCWSHWGGLQERVIAVCCHAPQGQNKPGFYEACFSEKFPSRACCRYLPPPGSKARLDPCLVGCTDSDLHNLAKNASIWRADRCALAQLIRQYHTLLFRVAWVARPEPLVSAVRALLPALELCQGLPSQVMWATTHTTLAAIRFSLGAALRFVQRSGQAASAVGTIAAPQQQEVESRARLRAESSWRHVSRERRLALEIGAAGGVTTNYLLREGYHVIAVEPNPQAVTAVRARFRAELAVGALQVLPVAVRGPHEPRLVPFHVSVDKPQQSHITAPELTTHRIAARTCGDIASNLTRTLDALIIDAEGQHLVCIEDFCRRSGLAQAARRHRPGWQPPRYLSVESADDAVLRALEACGYDSFKLVTQSQHMFYIGARGAQHDGLYGQKYAHWGRFGAIETGAGPIGEDALDWIAGPRWRPAAELREDFALLGNPEFSMMFYRSFDTGGAVVPTRYEWFDIHARHRSVRDFATVRQDVDP